jgi:hypothetical protein
MKVVNGGHIKLHDLISGISSAIIVRNVMQENHCHRVMNYLYFRYGDTALNLHHHHHHHRLYSPFMGPGRFFSFLILYTVGRSICPGDQPVAWPLPYTGQHKHRINVPSMPRVGLEPSTPMF